MLSLSRVDWTQNRHFEAMTPLRNFECAIEALTGPTAHAFCTPDLTAAKIRGNRRLGPHAIVLLIKQCQVHQKHHRYRER